jgi:hypothetical protein
MPDDLIKILVAATSGVIGGFISAVITARSKLRELEKSFRLSQQAKEAEERAKNQLQYLNPLRVSAMDLGSRLADIADRVERGDKFLSDSLVEIESRIRHNEEEFAGWANGVGEFSLSTLYMTMIYFARAARIRSELPFVKLSSGDDRELLSILSEVRRSLGGEYGIWESLQDSLGDYMRKEGGGLLTYREFCTQLEDESSYYWFHRVIDFYHDMHMKSADERKSMIDSLQALEHFLAEKPRETARDARPVS